MEWDKLECLCWWESEGHPMEGAQFHLSGQKRIGRFCAGTAWTWKGWKNGVAYGIRSLSRGMLLWNHLSTCGWTGGPRRQWNHTSWCAPGSQWKETWGFLSASVWLRTETGTVCDTGLQLEFTHSKVVWSQLHSDVAVHSPSQHPFLLKIKTRSLF